MTDENQFAREEIFERHQFFIFGNDRVGGLFPRQADVHSKTVCGPGAFVPGLHDAWSGAGDDHETGFHNLAPEIHGLLIFHFVRLRPGGAENGDLADVRIRREEAEGITHFAQRGLDHPHVAGLLYVGQQLERVFDDVGNLVFVVAAALVSDEFLDAAL